MGESMSVATQNLGLISQVSTERSSRSGLLWRGQGLSARSGGERIHSTSRNRLFTTCPFGLFPSAIAPVLELADTDRVLGLGLLDADGQAGRGAECRVRESASAELGELEHGRLVDRRRCDFDAQCSRPSQITAG